MSAHVAATQFNVSMRSAMFRLLRIYARDQSTLAAINIRGVSLLNFVLCLYQSILTCVKYMTNLSFDDCVKLTWESIVGARFTYRPLHELVAAYTAINAK